jgi:hypothetical protein
MKILLVAALLIFSLKSFADDSEPEGLDEWLANTPDPIVEPVVPTDRGIIEADLLSIEQAEANYPAVEAHTLQTIENYRQMGEMPTLQTLH